MKNILFIACVFCICFLNLISVNSNYESAGILSGLSVFSEFVGIISLSYLYHTKEHDTRLYVSALIILILGIIHYENAGMKIINQRLSIHHSSIYSLSERVDAESKRVDIIK